jgi:Fic family protein
MDSSKFSKHRTGELVEIYLPEADWAFVPDPLPPDWEFPGHLWPLLTQARESIARLDGIGRTLPNPQLLLHPLQSREALRSSSLEGTYASPQELLLFELNPRTPKSERDRANDWLEVSNYGKALRQGMALLEELPLSLRLIRELHRTLLDGVRGRERSPGEFRKYQVHVGANRRYIPPPPERLPECLNEFEKQMNQEDIGYDALVRCYLLHYHFEAIHPFRDGNGRVGRVLLSLMVYKWCNLYMPWLYMSAYFEKFKDEYIDNLFKVSSEGNWEDWIDLCLRGTISQANDSIRRCEELRKLRDVFHNQADAASARAHTIIEDLFTVPMVIVSALAKRCSVSYPTAKTDVEQLAKRGILKELEGSRPKAYYAPEILRIAYGEPEL